MDVGSLLQTHTEVAIALAGFAGVAAVLRRPLSPLGRLRFLGLLFTALIQVLGCLAPVWLSILGISGSFLWRVASALVLVLSTTLVLVLTRPQRAIDRDSFVLLNAAVNRVCIALNSPDPQRPYPSLLDTRSRREARNGNQVGGYSILLRTMLGIRKTA